MGLHQKLTNTLTILQMNDLHGYLEPHWEMVRETENWSFKKMGGLAKIARIFEETRKSANGPVIALDNGDTFHGTYLSNHDLGQSMIAPLNALKFDAMTTHWEFAYGPERVKEIEQQLKYPMLAINCYSTQTGELFFKPYQMIDRMGIKIAIIGLACPIVDKTMPPSFSKGVRFTIGNEELSSWIDKVKSDGADVVIVLSHLGFPQDVQLANDVSGIDILVSGHTHNRMDHAITENGAIIFQSGCHGSFIGKLEIEITEGKVGSFRHSLIAVDEAINDLPEINSMVDNIVSPHREKLNQVVGKIEGSLHRYAMLTSPMDDVLLEAIMNATGSEISFSNGWRYGAPIPDGPVTLGDLWNIIPVNPRLQTVEIKGSELFQMLEENLERTFAKNPYEQMGGYVKRMRGLTMYFKAENPKGCRVDRLFVGSKPVDRDAYYLAGFVTSQGVPEKFGRNRKKLEVDAITALKTLFGSVEVVSASYKQSVFEI